VTIFAILTVKVEHILQQIKIHYAPTHTHTSRSNIAALCVTQRRA